MNLLEFSQSRLRNAWLQEPGLSIYVRKGNRLLHNADFELANMEADEPGKGAFSAFLRRYSDKTFLVENVLNERLRGFLLRNGFRKVGRSAVEDDIAPTYIHAKCWHSRESA